MNQKRLPLILSAFIAISFLTGCANESQNTNRSDTSYAESQEQTDLTSDTQADGFDWESVRQDITLDGRKIDFPFSVNNLDKGYEIPYVTDDLFGENACYGTVEKPGEYVSETVCMVFFDGIKSDQYNDDVKCTRISSADSLMIQGIGKGSSFEDAEKILGKPYQSDDSARYYLSKSGNERIEVYYDAEDTDKVSEVQITIFPKNDEQKDFSDSTKRSEE